VFAIKAYLDTVKPVRQRSPDNELPWPLSMRAAMAGWNTLFFDAGTYQPQPDRSAQWNRGAYLVQGLLHCAACHTPKNVLGGSQEDRELFGGFAEHAYAPTLHGGMREGLGSWSVNDIVEYLKTGSNAKTSAAGPMAEVVQKSTQYLNDRDLTAIAVYLKKLPGDADHATADADTDDSNKVADLTMQRGHAIYLDNCEGCHMAKGVGLDRVFPPLAGSAAIMAAEPDTLIMVLLEGARIPATDVKPTGFKMPAFDAKLDDRQIADVLTYIRNAWGNHASEVSADEVAHKREVAHQAS
jgi:mono/diheme cytochrome c family protein